MTDANTTWMETPAVAIDDVRLQRNIELMQARASSHGVALRPHAKTHKSVEIAQRVLAAGAVGLTVSKPLEARRFMEAGFKDITLAYPVVVAEKLDRTLACANEHNVTFQLTVDSLFGAKVAAECAQSRGYVLRVLIHIDVGYHRVGLEESDPTLVNLVRFIQQSPSLQLLGILSHAGHSYGATSRDECEAIAETERQIMLRVKASIEAHLQLGSPVSVVSVGSTPTELARRNYDGLTELRPGNYIFQDRTPVRTGVSSVQNVSLSVIATVVSANAHHFIIDAGSKVLSADGVRGSGAFGSTGYGLVVREADFDAIDMEPSSHEFMLPSGASAMCFELQKLSEEHGWVAHAPAGRAFSPQIGDRVAILVNHSCPVVNLSNGLLVKGATPRTIELLSRGCCQ
ncbi:hypothetical protein ACHHYP_14134 [Achlya hypogyna]|uniref:D-serine dehydratase n=1 Tax=Achlya hypogyna TaxID=1202772 RepID=A0A1V9YDZ6_ACHHY|nr:hypothetical protein ACHHYP_14134 [Achlya hypogyna]